MVRQSVDRRVASGQRMANAPARRRCRPPRSLVVMVVAAVSCLGVGATAASTAGASTQVPRVPGAKVVDVHGAYLKRLGHVKSTRISGTIYARNRMPEAPPRSTSGCSEPNCPLVYNGGPVQHDPHIYLLFWGPGWSTSTETTSASYLERFYSGLGVEPKDNWSLVTSQYTDTSGTGPDFFGSVYRGAFFDTSTPPSGVNQSQLAAEATAFASRESIADGENAQVVVATQSGTCPQDFYAPTCNGGSGTYCAWHAAASYGTGWLTYTNLPYILDAKKACGEDYVNHSAGTNDGWSIVGGHEYAETITDPEPVTGWIDLSDGLSGGEIGDKCAWRFGVSGDITLSTGTFAVQSLYSNAAYNKTGSGCALSGGTTVTSVSPARGPATGGTPITITGTGFSSPARVAVSQAADSTGGVPASSVTVVSSTEIKAVTGPNATAGDWYVYVTDGLGTTPLSPGAAFAYTSAQPTVSGVSPRRGPTLGGTRVTVTGTALSGATAVHFGTAAAVLVACGASSCAVKSPAGSGIVDITVTTPGGTSARTSADKFTYMGAPSVRKLSPKHGPRRGGTVVTIRGANFLGVTAVHFGTKLAKIDRASATRIEVSSPRGSGTVEVTVTTPWGTSMKKRAVRFTYKPAGQAATSAGGPNQVAVQLVEALARFELRARSGL